MHQAHLLSRGRVWHDVGMRKRHPAEDRQRLIAEVKATGRFREHARAVPRRPRKEQQL